MTDVTFIGNEKGGVGKSLVTALLASFFAETEEAWPSIIEIDQERLHKTLGPSAITLTVPPGTDAAQLVGDPEAARELFNPVYEAMTGRPSVVDIGANAMTPFLTWAEHLPLPTLAEDDGVVPTFAFIVAPNPDALVEAINAYERAYALFSDRAHYAFVLNDNDGSGFGQFDDLEVRAYLDREQAAGRARILEVPHCDCRVARWASSRDTLPLHALRDFDRAAADLGLTRPGRAQQWNQLTRWVDRTRAALAPIVPKGAG